MRMFRFVTEDGRPNCVDIYRIVGFGEMLPADAPKDGKAVCTITVSVQHNCIIEGTGESFEELLSRYEIQILAMGE